MPSEERDLLLVEIRVAIQRLSLVSQVSAAPLGRATPSSDEDIGGKRPPGGIDRRDDREDTYRQKSADHFARRFARITHYHFSALELFRDEVLEAIEAWKRGPLTEGQDPASVSDPNWKRWVGQSDLPLGEIARRYSVSRQYVSRVKQAYGPDHAA